MIYRYTVSDDAGAVVSKHRNYLGAMDSIANLRATAEARCEPDRWHIYDERAKQIVNRAEVPECSMPAGRGSGDLLVPLTLSERTALTEIAADLGALAVSGRTVGRPSVVRLIKRIARGELVVSRPS